MVVIDAPVLYPDLTRLPPLTSGLVRLAAPVLREKCISAVTNIPKVHISTSVNLPTVITLLIFDIKINKKTSKP